MIVQMTRTPRQRRRRRWPIKTQQSTLHTCQTPANQNTQRQKHPTYSPDIDQSTRDEAPCLLARHWPIKTQQKIPYLLARHQPIKTRQNTPPPYFARLRPIKTPQNTLMIPTCQKPANKNTRQNHALRTYHFNPTTMVHAYHNKKHNN